MKQKIWLILTLLVLSGFVIFGSQIMAEKLVLRSETPSPEMAKKGYVGPQKCAECHQKIYNDYRATAHPYKLRPVEEARIVGLPLPEGYTWDDISYVVGGRRWKSRYMDKNGYIITMTGKNREIKGKNQYNIATGTWVDYHPGEKKPYDCGSCHTTGYSKEGHQDGLEGIIGTWALPGITCEECHGPGMAHIEAKGKGNIIKETSSAFCGKCHVRGEKNKIPASGGFIRHHEQYNELLASPHNNAKCVECHNPHKPLKIGIVAECSSCHGDVAKEFKGSKMEKVGKTCEDCHMPYATKSAVFTARWQGDVKTHLFKINIDPEAKMFTDDGKWAKGYLTLYFACLQCHMDRDKTWAAQYAKKAHTIGK
ncbi:MAG: multiheme c-type cytochrome [Thermodesulfobacteriota bacterium]